MDLVFVLLFRFEKEKPAHTGSIIVVSSIAGKEGLAGLGAYCASNWARLGLTKTLALELAMLQ